MVIITCNKYVKKISFLTCFCFFISIANGDIHNQYSDNTYFKKANYFLQHSQLDSALQNLRYASAKFISEKNYNGLIIAQNSIGEILLQLGKPDESLKMLITNEGFIKEKTGIVNEQFCRCYDLMGDFYMSISDVDAAKEKYDISYSLRLKLYGTDDARTAFSQINLSSYFTFKMKHDSAFYYAQSAYKICKMIPEHVSEIRFDKVICQYAYAYKINNYINYPETKIKHVEQTEKIYEEAIELISKRYGTNDLRLANIYRSVGNLYNDIIARFEGSDAQKIIYFKNALKYYNASIALNKKFLGTQHPNLSVAYYVKGLLYEYAFASDSLSLALENYNNAIQALLPQPSKDHNNDMVAIFSSPYKFDLMTLLKVRGDCYHNMENLKAAYYSYKTAVKLWREIIKDFKSPYTNRLLTTWNGGIFHAAFTTALELYKIEKDSVYLYDSFWLAEESKNSLRDKLLLQSGNISMVKQNISFASVQQIQANLDSLTAFIEYFGNIGIICITKERLITLKIKDEVELDSLFNEYKLSLQKNDVSSYHVIAGRLFDVLLKPVLIEAGSQIQNLVIIPDGISSKISFSSLITDTTYNEIDFRKLKYAFLKYNIRYQLSGSYFINEHVDMNNYNHNMIAFAPHFENLSSLPFSSKIVAILSDKIKGEFLSGKNAVKKEFVNHAKDYSVIHLSTHAYSDESERTNSKIYFTGNDIKTDDYILIDSIYSIPFQTELAVLSACETNYGREEYSEGMLSFSKAFIYAGCKSTVTTLWKVDDQSTSTLINDFYEHILNDENKATSLTLSQKKYLENCQTSMQGNPLYWSGVVLTGNPKPILLEKKTGSLMLPVLGGISILSVIIFFRRRRAK